jgi:hypothetical protein
MLEFDVIASFVTGFPYGGGWAQNFVQFILSLAS